MAISRDFETDGSRGILSSPIKFGTDGWRAILTPSDEFGAEDFRDTLLSPIKFGNDGLRDVLSLPIISETDGWKDLLIPSIEPEILFPHSKETVYSIVSSTIPASHSLVDFMSPSLGHWGMNVSDFSSYSVDVYHDIEAAIDAITQQGQPVAISDSSWGIYDAMPYCTAAHSHMSSNFTFWPTRNLADRPIHRHELPSSAGCWYIPDIRINSSLSLIDSADSVRDGPAKHIFSDITSFNMNEAYHFYHSNYTTLNQNELFEIANSQWLSRIEFDDHRTSVIGHVFAHDAISQGYN